MVARVLGMVTRAVARLPRVVARVLLRYSGCLLGRFLGCWYAVARVLGVVARVPRVVARVLLSGF